MAITTQKQRIIKYLNRDFESFKRDFVEHLRIYFPNSIEDFNESSVGMMFTELVSFIGDNLSYYLDKKFQESFISTAREKKNLFKHAKQLGFKPFGKSAATGIVDGFIKVPIITTNRKTEPDIRFAGTIKKGARVKGENGQPYETLVDIDFSKVDITDPNFVTVADRDPATKEATTFALKRSNIDIRAGETKTTTFAVTAYEAFKKLTITEEDVLEVIEVTDSEANQWYEVDYLAQDTVFDATANTGEDATEVPYVLKLRSVPYRFVTEYNVDTKKLSLLFGTGDADKFDGDLIPDLGDLSLPLYGRDTFTDFFLDPQNFLKTRTLGLAPTNTTLTVKYRVGGGLATNAAAEEIQTVVGSTFEIGDSSLSTTVVKDVQNSFSVINPKPIQGGKDELSIQELKELISANFAAQGRMVTAPDFVVRSLSMPTKFGSVFRANANPSVLNKNAVELIILSRNSVGNVSTAPQDLKENLKKYLSRFRMLTDAIEILDGEIINIAINFDILTNPDFNKSEVLSNCIESLKEFFEVEKIQINQPINLTDIISLLAQIPGVLSIININVINKVGTVEGKSYSTTVHNIMENTKNGIIYSKENAIFEIKFPNTNIAGTAK